MTSRDIRLNRINVAVIAIIAAGIILRLYGTNWDEGLYLHPDERFIAIVSSERIDLPEPGRFTTIFEPANSPMNPRRDGPDGRPLSFAYGTLPIYVQSVVSWAVNLVANSDFQSYHLVFKVGRPLTVMFDALTMLFVFLLARRLFGDAAALVATALYALCVLAIQLSHFFTVDVWLTCFVTATLYCAVRYVDHPSLPRALLMGLPVGCAFATKASVPALLLPLLVAAGWTLWHSNDRGAHLRRLALASALALAVFTAFEPYAIARPAPFIEDVGLQSRIVRGRFDVPFTRQFVGLTPGVYELQNLARYSLGPAFTVAALLGIAFAARRALRGRDIALSVPLALVLAYVPTILFTEAKFLRYGLPLFPVFAIVAGGFLVHGLRQYHRTVSQGAITLVIGITAIWAIGFVSIYGSEHPRIAASKWMHAHIPPGSAVSVEAWDDALPLPYQGAPPMTYSQITFDMYGDEPPEQKVETLATSLHSVDYVILSSNRVIDSVDNLPWRYAVQNEFYRRLLAGQLGFQLVYEAELRPSLFGFRYDDSRSDESFTVYDHPHVRIFQKVEELTTAEVRDRLLWGIDQPWIPQRYPPEATLRLPVPAGEIDSTRDAGWNRLAVNNALFAVLFWLISIEIIGLAVLPVAASLLRRSPDRGAFSARLLGLLVVSWIAWFAASVGLWRSLAIYHAAIVLVVAAIAWGWRWKASHPPRLPSPGMYAAGAGVWLAVFSFFLMLRATYPDFWQTWFGGEKPFELAYLRAVASSTSFPPYDPWFADGTINYYYYGWHVIATMTKLTGVGVDHGFQMALASVAGLLAVQAASLGGLLARRGRSRLPLPSVIVAGAIVLFATVFAGNLDAVHQVVGERALFADTFDFWRSTRVVSYTINEFPFFSFLWADVHPHVINFPIVMLLLTLLVHLVLDARPEPGAWMLAPLASIALVLGTIGVTNSWDAPLAIGLTVAALAYVGLLRNVRSGVIGLSLAALTVAASFALFAPFYLGFYSVVDGAQRASAGSPLGEFLVVWGIFFLIVVTASLSDALARAPDSVGVRDGLALAVVTLLAGSVAQAVDTLSGSGVPRREIVIALVLSAAVVAIAAAATSPSRFSFMPRAGAVVASATIGTMVVYRPAGAVAIAIGVAAGLYAYRLRRQPSRFIPWTLICMAALILTATEVMYVADDLQRSPWERMNTVFKFYLQAWTLFGVGAGVILAGMLPRSRLLPKLAPGANGVSLGILAAQRARCARKAEPAERSRSRVRRAAAIIGLAVLSLGVIYPLAGTPVRLSQDMATSPTRLTLNGYAWMDGGYIHNHTGEVIEFSGDLAAIKWLNENVRGTPVILEAAIGPYRGNGGRISSATGLPAVLGWDRHQRQQRYEPGISKRMSDVRAIYNDVNPASKLEMLRRYRVEYVIVGDVERYWNNGDDTTFYASTEGLNAFADMVGAGLTVAFESGATRVYRVDDFPRIEPLPRAVQRR